MSEKLQVNRESHEEGHKGLEQAGKQQREALAEQFEHTRHSPENTGKEQEQARHEALELATSRELRQENKNKHKRTAEKHLNKPTKHELDASFTKTMEHIRKDMKPASKVFSKVIHNPIIDKVSTATEKTIARPNLVLAGALGTIILCGIIYFVAKTYAYPLSGSEAIATFIVGWVIGAIIEYIRVGFFNQRTQ